MFHDNRLVPAIAPISIVLVPSRRVSRLGRKAGSWETICRAVQATQCHTCGPRWPRPTSEWRRPGCAWASHPQDKPPELARVRPKKAQASTEYESLALCACRGRGEEAPDCPCCNRLLSAPVAQQTHAGTASRRKPAEPLCTAQSRLWRYECRNRGAISCRWQTVDGPRLFLFSLLPSRAAVCSQTDQPPAPHQSRESTVGGCAPCSSFWSWGAADGAGASVPASC